MLQFIVIRHGERSNGTCQAGQTPLTDECHTSSSAQPFSDSDLTAQGYCRANALVGFLGQFKKNLARIYATTSSISAGNCGCAKCIVAKCNTTRREQLSMIPFSLDSCTPVTLIGCKEDYFAKAWVIAQDVFRNKLTGNIVVCLDHGGIGTFLPTLVETLSTGKQQPSISSSKILKYPGGDLYDAAFIMQFTWGGATLTLSKMDIVGECLLTPQGKADPNDRTSSYCLVQQKGKYAVVPGKCPVGSPLDNFYKSPICSASSVLPTPCDPSALSKCVRKAPGFSLVDTCKTGCPANCSNNGTCTSGACVCKPGYLGGDCSMKCAAVACPGGGNCSGHGSCAAGVCTCTGGYSGADCATAPGVPCPGGGNCSGNGTCGPDGTCTCKKKWSGVDCATAAPTTCPGGGNCSGQGKCGSGGTCVCYAGFMGDDCSSPVCLNKCSGNGNCISGNCVCNPGFSGADCSARTCTNDCSGRGVCSNGNCNCQAGFLGESCDIAATTRCPSSCSGNGKCVSGKCQCDQGWSGEDCGTVAYSYLYVLLFLLCIATILVCIYLYFFRGRGARRL